MNKGFWVFLLLLFAVPLGAQEKVKIGLVDIQRAINESQAGKKAKEKFQAQIKKAEADLLREKQEVERLRTDFDKKGSLLKEEQRRNLERDIQKRERGYMISAREYQEELRQREGEMTSEILKDLLSIVSEIGKSEKFTLIIERSQVPYGDQTIDITDKVIELYNSRASGKVTKGK